MDNILQEQTTAVAPPAARQRALVKFISFGLVLSLLGLLAWGLINSQSGPKKEGPAPDFTLVTFDNQTVKLSELRGQVVVINFWASWCVPCRQEADYLERTWQKYKDQGVAFIGVAYADTDKESRAFIQEFGVTYYNGPDLGTAISQAYKIQGIPETFFISKTGELRGVRIGPFLPPELDEKIDALLRE